MLLHRQFVAGLPPSCQAEVGAGDGATREPRGGTSGRRSTGRVERAGVEARRVVGRRRGGRRRRGTTAWSERHQTCEVSDQRAHAGTLSRPASSKPGEPGVLVPSCWQEPKWQAGDEVVVHKTHGRRPAARPRCREARRQISSPGAGERSAAATNTSQPAASPLPTSTPSPSRCRRQSSRTRRTRSRCVVSRASRERLSCVEGRQGADRVARRRPTLPSPVLVAGPARGPRRRDADHVPPARVGAHLGALRQGPEQVGRSLALLDSPARGLD